MQGCASGFILFENMFALMILALVWKPGPGDMSVYKGQASTLIKGSGTCYLVLSDSTTPSGIRGVSFRVSGKGTAAVRLVLDIHGSAFGVAQRFEVDGDTAEVILARDEAVLLQMIPPAENAPDRAFLFIDAQEPVNIRVWGLKIW